VNQKKITQTKVEIIKTLLYETGKECKFHTVSDVIQHPSKNLNFINFGVSENDTFDLVQGHKKITPKLSFSDMEMYLIGMKNGCNIMKK
jgi:hypothetical protein